MKTIYLLSEELNYELRLRNIVTRKDMPTKRKILNKRLANSSMNDNEVIALTDPEYVFETEKIIITDTLDQLRTMINDFSGPETDSGFQKIKSRLIYISYRIQRIVVPQNEDAVSIQDFKNESYATCIELEALLDDSVMVNENPLSNVATVVDMNSTLQIPRMSVVNNPIQKSIPVYKWNITKFNGESNLLFSFLNRVDELAKARNVSKDDLLSSAADLFTDKAYIWYKSIASSVKDWEHLVSLLKTYFLPLDFDDRIWDDIRGRTQGKKEPIHIYIAVMQTYFNHLQKPVHDSTKLKYIRKGILPHYNERLSVVVTPITTVEHLLDWCRKIDECQQYANEYHSPPKTSNLCPELVYLSSEPSTSTSDISVNTISNNKDESRLNKNTFHKNFQKNSYSKSNDATTKICWNCRKINHSFRYCTAKRTKFCFKCGKQNETTKSCSCSKNV